MYYVLHIPNKEGKELINYINYPMLWPTLEKSLAALRVIIIVLLVIILMIGDNN